MENKLSLTNKVLCVTMIKIMEQTFSPTSLPNVRISEEYGTLLLSILLKSLNPAWGNNSYPIARMIGDYFKFLPLDPNTAKVIAKFQQANFSENDLYQLAITFNHSERNQFVLERLMQRTRLPLETITNLQTDLITELNSFSQLIDNSPLKQVFATFQHQDSQQRLEELEELRLQLAEVNQFFQFKTNQIELIFTPTDPLFSEYLGQILWISPSQVLLMTHRSEIKFQIYQFLRLNLEPTVKQLMPKLSDAQRQKIIQYASGKSRQYYGNNPQLLLQTALISVYYNQVKMQRNMADFTTFAKQVDKLTDKQFLQSLETNHQLRDRCRYLNIRNLTEFKANLKLYHQTFNQDNLYPILGKFYQFYQNQRQNITFEQFALLNLPKTL